MNRRFSFDQDGFDECTKRARWFDWLWFAVPIVGFMLFMLSIEAREKKP